MVEIITPPSDLDLHNLRAIKILGKGATGTVFLVHENWHHDEPFAVKVVEKSSIRHADRRAGREISVLRRLSRGHHPFLPRLIASSEAKEFICWATPFCHGGDLNVLRHRQNDGVFSPAAIRFYLAEILCAIERLHELGIVYRDLKPENVLIQQSGHVTLTDFDLSRDLCHRPPLDFHCEPSSDTAVSNTSRPIISKKCCKKPKAARVSPVIRRNNNESFRSNSFVGTEEYIAPEIIKGDSHDFSVDWWALGVLCYEMLYGKTPFKGRNRKETFGKIVFTDPVFVGKRTPLTDLIGKLLEKDPTRRLGYRRGAWEIKEHEFFKGLRWDLLTEVLRPPFLPEDQLAEAKEGGIDVREYFQKRRILPSPLCSPSMDECGQQFKEF